MKSFKKLYLMLSMLAFTLVFTACGKSNAPTDSSKASESSEAAGKKVVVTTTFIKDMVKEITAGEVTPELIIPAGEDPHLFVAKPEHLKHLQEADLVLYHGLHFEGKMMEPLEKKGVAITKDFDKKEVGSMEEDGQTIMDPHFWFDLSLYKKAVKAASESLVQLFPEKKDAYTKNTEAYLGKLDDLDKEIREKLEQIPKESRYLITPHDAFNYFSRSYGIEVVAPQGVSTEVEVSNKDIEKTAQFIVDKKIKAIFAESTTNPERMTKLQEIVKQKGFDVKVVNGENEALYSDSLGNDGEKTSSFIEMYRHNIDLIVNNLK